MFRKVSQIALAAVLVCVVVYGVGYAKPSCCREKMDKCFQASERAPSDLLFAAQCKTTVPTRPWKCVLPEDRSNCCDPFDECCNKTGKGAPVSAALSVFRTSESPDSSDPANAIAADFDRPEICGQKPAQKHREILPSKTPLFIQVKSILC